MGDIWNLVNLSLADCLLLGLICFAAGLVRGFSGFALSALVMAAAVSILPPVQLIPILWIQEVAASVLMARGGWQDADRKLTGLLVLGNWTGWPLGLYLTQTLPEDQSKLAALAVILVLAALQLARLRIPGLATNIGALVTGAVAGVVAGVAHVGGMVVALYVLSQGRAARNMRGTLVLYLFVGSLGSFVMLLWFGVMSEIAFWRGALFVAPTLVGVWLGTRMFSPRWEPYYRPFCLGLLIFLALVGLLRLGMS